MEINKMNEDTDKIGFNEWVCIGFTCFLFATNLTQPVFGLYSATMIALLIVVGLWSWGVL